MTATGSEFRPLISIVIPVFNGVTYLEQAIESALNQTYANIEVIVVNDGSDDQGQTEQVATSFGDRIRYISKPNGGVATALNAGIAAMQGDYFSWLSHDDLYLPTKIAMQVGYLAGLQNRQSVLYSDYEIVDGDGAVTGVVRLSSPDPELFQQALILGLRINGCSLLVPRVCFESWGAFDEDLATTQDFALWFALAERFEFLHQGEVLIRSRLHEAQTSKSLSGIHYEERNALLIDFLSRLLESGRFEGPSALFCLRCARRFRKRRWNDAYAYARKMSVDSGGGLGLPDKLKLLAGLALLRGPRQPRRKWLRGK